jgi:tetratricopeptide (TPR) repeat protein
MRRGLHRRVALASIIALITVGVAVGCQTTRPFQCPSNGGTPWRELASDHFVVRTDLDADEARELLHRLERMRAAVLAALFDGAPETPGRVEVVAFRTDREFKDFAPEGVSAYYLRYAGGPPRIVLSGEIASWQRALLAHELTHHYLAAVFARLPRWLGEGLAVYMETLGEQRPDRGLVIGGAPPARLARARESPMPVNELLRWDGTVGTKESLDFYASSWLLVHYLANKRAPAFAELQRRLAEGEAPQDAWRASFPEYDLARTETLIGLDRTLAWYARAELKTRARHVKIAVVGDHLEQPMPAVEVHALRLALWSQGPDKSDGALRAEVAEALREEPHHPIALQVLASFEGQNALALARKAVSSHPDDPRAWTFLAGSLADHDRAEREEAYRRAADLAPDNPAALHNLAVELLEAGRSGEALPFARRAVGLAPWSPPLLAGYAAVLSDLGQCAQSIPLTQRALEALPDRASNAARVELRGSLTRYVEQCRYATVNGAEAPGAP